MTDPTVHRTLPNAGFAILIATIISIRTSGWMLHFAFKIQESPLVDIFYLFAVLYAVILWVQYDAHRQGFSLGLDQGLLLYTAWPVIVPCYIYKTRGFVSGSLMILAFIGLWVFSLIPAILLGMLLWLGQMLISAWR